MNTQVPTYLVEQYKSLAASSVMPIYAIMYLGKQLNKSIDVSCINFQNKPTFPSLPEPDENETNVNSRHTIDVDIEHPFSAVLRLTEIAWACHAHTSF